MASDVHESGATALIAAAHGPAAAWLLVAVLILLLQVPLSTARADLSSEAAGNIGDEQLPALGNSAAMDRLMLREIADDHVHDSDPAPVACCPEGGSSGQTDGSDRAMPASTVWSFVRQSRRLRIPDNEIIDNYRQQYRREAIWISKILQRATPMVGHIVAHLDQRYMPVELALLPAIESGYRADVHSAENAAGLWQIVPATAREAGITHTAWFDGRADLLESTRAALDYLGWLNAEFHGDWQLTLAAYNAGPGRVRAAMRQNRSRGKPLDFWSLPLPRETREYVPKFLALVAMLRHDSPAGLEVPRIARGNGFDVLAFTHRVSLDRIAAVSGVAESALKQLNAALLHGVTPPAGPHHVYIDKRYARRIIDAVSAVPATALYTLPTTHRVVAGDTIGTLAERYGLSQSELMTLNELDSSLIRIGDELIVRFSGDEDDNRIEYVVTIGDTLSDIARRFSVSLDRVRDDQGRPMGSDVIHPGQTLSILLHGDSSTPGSIG